ncbi:MAG TPA: V-type ATPase 116kDa subunit family protein [Trueperaceae bacterium]|nr:V-type ATPase 116kDa subunit family protein [Trueperaceae bacterium]
MLLPERLREVSLFVLERDIESVSEVILRAEALHPEDVESDALTPKRGWGEVAQRAERLARRARAALDAIGLTPQAAPPPQPVRPTSELDALEAQLTLTEARTGEWQARAERNRRELESLALTRSQLELLEPLDVPVEALASLRHHHLVLGTLPSENLPRVAASLFMIAFVLVPVRSRSGRTLVVAASARDDAAILDRALRSAFFEPAPLPPDARGEPRQALVTVDRGISEARARADALATERAELAAALRESLVPLEARLRAAAALADAIRRFPSRGEVYLVAGWVPQRSFERLAGEVRAAASAPVVLQSEPPARERHGVPTLLRAPAWLRPFQMLVTTYGLSGYGEVDPTLPAAITFLLMYGMMFGDVGHGLLLAGAALLLTWRSGAPLGKVMAAAGVSGALFGLLYGTVLGAPLLPALWLRPLDRVQDLLLAAIAAGVVVLNLGFALNLATRLRARDWSGLLLDKSGVVGLLFYWVLLGGGALAVLGRLPVWVVLAALALPAALLWLREPLLDRLLDRERAPLGDALVTGFFELFETALGYASNSLSFVRLGAFAVAHEGLSGMVMRYAEGPVGWLVLLVGTVVIVGFEGLVVGIQALRLEYFEFFGRFFRGDGVPFVPLSIQGGLDVRSQI